MCIWIAQCRSYRSLFGMGGCGCSSRSQKDPQLVNNNVEHVLEGHLLLSQASCGCSCVDFLGAQGILRILYI